MSGGSSGEDNPVGINVVPMVDIIFCLCVFFMCSFKFKELEGRLQSWLPKDLGNGPVLTDPPPEMRVVLWWDAVNAKTVRQFGMRLVASDDELGTLLAGAHEDCVKLGKPETPLILDGDARVPWSQVIYVINLSKRLGIARFEFAQGAAPTAR